MKRLALLLLAAAAAVFAIVWFVPSVQDALITRVARQRLLAPADLAWGDDTLSVLLCGTSSPLAHPTRGHPCTAVIAGGRIYLVDVGPDAWTHLALRRVPADRIEAVLLTHLHSDHIGDLGEINLQSWVGGRPGPLAVYGPVGTGRPRGPTGEPRRLTTDRVADERPHRGVHGPSRPGCGAERAIGSQRCGEVELG